MLKKQKHFRKKNKREKDISTWGEVPQSQSPGNPELLGSWPQQNQYISGAQHEVVKGFKVSYPIIIYNQN